MEHLCRIFNFSKVVRYGPATLLKITLIHRVLYQDFDSDNKLDGVYIMGTLT